MKSDFKFQSSREHYTADACIVWCFDDRFSDLLEAFKKERGFKHADVVKCAGGAKALAADGSNGLTAGGGPERDFVLNQIKTSIKLHKTPIVILMVHIDCGGYGGSAAFGNDRDAERRHHEAELGKAAGFVQSQLPGIAVESHIADFDGVREVAPELELV
jgi:hypothetical protein